MPSPVLPPSSLAALVSWLHPPHTASGPDEPQFSETPGPKMPEKRPSFWVISAPHPTADKPIPGGQLPSAQSPPLHSTWVLRRSWRKGSLPPRQQGKGSQVSHCSPEFIQPLPFAPIQPSLRSPFMLPGRRTGGWGQVWVSASSAPSFPGLAIATKPLNLATCCRHHLPGRLPGVLV